MNQRGQGLGEEHAVQAVITGVCRVHHDCCQPGAVGECVIADASDAGGDGDARQPGAGGECSVADAGDAGGEGDARQPGAVGECVIADAGDTGWEGDARQPGAFTECLPADAGDAGGDGDARQPGAGGECVIADAGDAGGEGDTRQPGAGGECSVADAGDAVWNDHGGDGRLVVECLVADGDHRQRIDRARNAHRTARAGVSGDGDGAIGGSEFVIAGNALGDEDVIISVGGAPGIGGGEAVVVSGARREGAEIIGRDIQGRRAVVRQEGDGFHAAVVGGGTVFEPRGGGPAVRVNRAGKRGGRVGGPSRGAGYDEGRRDDRDGGSIRIRPGGIGGICDLDPIFSCVSERRGGEGGGVGTHGCGDRAGCALIPLVSDRLGADGGDGEGGGGASGDGDGCRVRDDPRIGHGHGSVALPGGRGEAGLGGEVIEGEAGGGVVEYIRAHRRGVAEKESSL